MKKHFALVIALGISSSGSFAQQVRGTHPGNPGMYPASLEFNKGLEPEFVKGTVLLQKDNQLTKTNEVILRSSEADMLGMEHYRYQQTINSIPVEGAVYAVHVAGGKVKSQNGDWIANPPADLASSPSINASQALDAAMNDFGAKSYKWQIPEEEMFIKKESGDQSSTFKPKAELVYYADDNNINVNKIRLAYKLDVYAHDPIGRRVYFVDALNGEILGEREIMHNVHATGTAITAYRGSQTISTDNIAANTYILRDVVRGNGINTLNMNKGMNYANATDFFDADNYWNNVNANKDQYAADAHYGAEVTYDYFKNTFGRNSINNAGFAINSYVHYSSNYFNAFWDGARMVYGDGSSKNGYKPLTSVDVCGHEIAHGLTSFTAGLNYSYESGALNEGFSDIFGTTIEFYANPSTGNWQLGEAFYTVRSMSNPKAYNQPNTYKGVNWAGGTADHGGVHTNSGVLNYWYYLLTAGGSGTNDYNFAYTVSGIGLAKAAAIAYRTLTVYLTPNSQYADARTYSIQSATDLYGASSNEVAQVIAAWNAVNVTVPVPPPPCSDVFESNNVRTVAKSISINADIPARLGVKFDKDYYVFTTTNAAPKFKITMTNLPADYDLKLYNAAGSQIASSAKSKLTSESITYNASSVGATYYAYIFGFNGSFDEAGCYLLRVHSSSFNQSFDEYDESEQTFKPEMDEMEVAAEGVSVFPNPATDHLTVKFTAEAEGKQSITITDLVGRVIMNQEVEVMEGRNNIKLSLDSYKSGIYFLHVAGQQSVKFLITE